ncbi:MAG: hypothetical protein V1799_19990, partial [bacterium]
WALLGSQPQADAPSAQKTADRSAQNLRPAIIKVWALLGSQPQADAPSAKKTADKSAQNQ